MERYMSSTEICHEFDKSLLLLSDLCLAVAFTFTGDMEVARRLAEETLIRVWADRDSLDMSEGLKMCVLSRLRSCYIQKYQKQEMAIRQPVHRRTLSKIQ